MQGAEPIIWLILALVAFCLLVAIVIGGDRDDHDDDNRGFWP